MSQAGSPCFSSSGICSVLLGRLLRLLFGHSCFVHDVVVNAVTLNCGADSRLSPGALSSFVPKRELRGYYHNIKVASSVTNYIVFVYDYDFYTWTALCLKKETF